MSSTPVPDQETYYSSRRQDDVDALAWPVFSQHALDLLRSAGEVLHPEPGELGMLMGQRAFLPGVAMKETAVLRVASRSCVGSWRSQGSLAMSCSPRSTPGGVC